MHVPGRVPGILVDADGVQASSGKAEEEADIGNIGDDDNAAGRRLGVGPRRQRSAGHVLIAPDKFKGSLRASEVAAHVAAGLRTAAPDLDVVQLPVADGGDGTLDAAAGAGYRLVPVRASGPTGRVVDTAHAVRDGVAVVELADACGLDRLPEGRPAPLTASSAGVGDVLHAVLDAGCTRVVLAIGGSASTDGGAGMLTALGARLLDVDGAELPPGGGALSRLHRVDLAGLHPGPLLERVACRLAEEWLR